MSCIKTMSSWGDFPGCRPRKQSYKTCNIAVPEWSQEKALRSKLEKRERQQARRCSTPPHLWSKSSTRQSSAVLKGQTSKCANDMMPQVVWSQRIFLFLSTHLVHGMINQRQPASDLVPVQGSWGAGCESQASAGAASPLEVHSILKQESPHDDSAARTKDLLCTRFVRFFFNIFNRWTLRMRNGQPVLHIARLAARSHKVSTYLTRN